MGLAEDIRSGKNIILTEDFEYASYGKFASIYTNNETGLAIKIPFRHPGKNYGSNRITHGYRIQKKIFDAGYPVPEPYGIVRGTPKEDFVSGIFIDGDDHLDFRKCLFMEMIRGYNLFHGQDMYSWKDICKKNSEAQEIASDIKKRMGIFPRKEYGVYSRNIMWDEENKRVVLVDFEDWEEI